MKQFKTIDEIERADSYGKTIYMYMYAPMVVNVKKHWWNKDELKHIDRFIYQACEIMCYLVDANKVRARIMNERGEWFTYEVSPEAFYCE